MATFRKIGTLLSVAPGFVLQVYGIVAGDTSAGIAGTFVLVLALGYHIRQKGYHPAWGLWGVVPIMGAVLLLLQRPNYGVSREEIIEEILLEEDPHIRSFATRRQVRIVGGFPLLLVMAPIGLLLVLFGDRLENVRVSVAYERPAQQRIAEPPRQSDGISSEGMETPVQMTPTIVSVQTLHAMSGRDDESEEGAGSAVTDAKPDDTAEEAAETVETEVDDSFAAKHASLDLGMKYDRACEVMGAAPVSLSSASDNGLVRWDGPDDEFFFAHFQDGELDRISGLRSRAPAVPATGALAQAKADTRPAAKDGQPVGDGDGGDSGDSGNSGNRWEEPVAAERPSSTTSANEASDSIDRAAGLQADVADEEETVSDVAEETWVEDAGVSRVTRVAEAGAATGRTTYKKARLPRFTRPIERGPHDVVIYNPNSYPVQVGVRSGKRGKDLSIGASGSATIYLPNGEYSVSYVAQGDAEDARLYNAGNFSVASPLSAIRIYLR